MAPLFRPARGFTLIELVLVMVIVGVLGAIGAARFFDRATYDAAAYTDQMRALIRYGQKVAIAQNRPVFVRLNGSNIALCFSGVACADADKVRPGSGNAGNAGSGGCGGVAWACEPVPSGVVYHSGAVAAFYFDQLGRPCAATDAFGVANPSFQQLTINVTGDSTTRAIVVEQETGYVH